MARKPKEKPEVIETEGTINEATPEEVVADAPQGNGHLPVPTVQVQAEQIAEITPEAAHVLIQACEYDKQRPTSPSTVQRYSDLMRSGDFGLSVGWIGWVGAQPFLINMKHRLTACVQAGVPFRCIIVETWHDTKRDVDQIYANQDRGKDRTAGDFLRVLGEEQLGSLEQAEGNRLATAVCFLMTGFQNASPTSARPAMQDVLFRVKMASVYRKVAQDYFDAIREAKGDLRKALLRAPVVAVALAIMEEQPVKGAAFFRRIAQNDALGKQSPEWWMTTNILQPGKYTSRENLRFTRAIAHAWNAYYDDRLLPEFKLPPRLVEQPIELRGTSYSNRVVNIPEKLSAFRAALGTAPQPRKRQAYKRAGRRAVEQEVE